MHLKNLTEVHQKLSTGESFGLTFAPIFYSPGLRAVSTDENENTNLIFNGI